MMNRFREWGFPVGLLLLWGMAAAYTLSALIGMDARLQATQVPQQLTQITERPVLADVHHTRSTS
jgi:hypothetical protein